MRKRGSGNGKNYLDIQPEIKKQIFFQHSKTVLKTGISFHGLNKEVGLVIDRVTKAHYFNYSFISLIASDGTI